MVLFMLLDRLMYLQLVLPGFRKWKPTAGWMCLRWAKQSKRQQNGFRKLRRMVRTMLTMLTMLTLMLVLTPSMMLASAVNTLAKAAKTMALKKELVHRQL